MALTRDTREVKSNGRYSGGINGRVTLRNLTGTQYHLYFPYLTVWKGSMIRGELQMHTVGDYMNANVLFMNPDQSLDDAYRLMQEMRVRHIPIVDGFRLVGIITLGDIKWFLRKRGDEINCEKKSITEAMTRNVITCSKFWSLEKAARCMAKHNIGCLPVLQNSELVGVITTRDILLGLIGEREQIDQPQNGDEMFERWAQAGKSMSVLDADFRLQSFST